MLILQLAACIGMVSGCFLLFHIRLTDFTTEVFQGLLGRPKNLQDAIREEMHTKKVSYLKRELLEIQDILTATGREKQFPLLCTVSFVCSRCFCGSGDGEPFFGACSCSRLSVCTFLVY